MKVRKVAVPDKLLNRESLLQEELDSTSAQLFRFYEDLQLALDEKEAAFKALAIAQQNTLLRLTLAAELRDGETGQHIVRVGEYAYQLANALGLDDNFCHAIRLASPMHDIGKLGVPDRILKKPGRLDEDEMNIIRSHPEYGAMLLGEGETDVMKMAVEIALGHHEKFDGTGYPYGQAKEDIALSCRIVAVADVFDALISDRVYRPAFSIGDAIVMMTENSGNHFDPDIIEVFMNNLDSLIHIQSQTSDIKEASLVSFESTYLKP